MNLKKLGIIFLIFMVTLMLTGILQSMFLTGAGIMNPVIGGVGIPVIGAAILTVVWFYVIRKQKK